MKSRSGLRVAGDARFANRCQGRHVPDGENPARKYQLIVVAYTPPTREQQVRLGPIPASYHAAATIEVKDDGELIVPDLELKPSR